MSKSKKKAVFETKTVKKEQKTPTVTHITRVLACFLALLMILGAISSALYFFLAQSVSSPSADVKTYVSTEANYNDISFTDTSYILTDDISLSK